MQRTIVNAATLLFCATMTVSVAAAQTGSSPAPSPVTAAEADSQAVSVLARSAAALKETDALTADFVTSTTYTVPYRDTEERGTITIARPGSVRVDLTRHRRIRAGQDWEPTGNGALIVADGKQVWSLTRHPASSQIRTDTQRPESLVSALRGIDPLLPFFTPQATTGRYLGKQTVDGTPVEVVETTDTGTGERRQYFVREDGFPIKTITTTPAKTGGAVTREVRLTNVRRNPSLASNTFAFTPPTDAIPVERAASRQASAATKPSTLAVGQPAPDFTVQDAAGKPVRLSDYKGKTVVLKFWATWCWPCRQSLPGTQDLAKSGEKNGVTVLAVALWDSPVAFGKWTKANAAKYPSLHFAFDPSPQARDTGSALYGVTVTPTEYVIGPDGTVRAVFQGYDGPSSALALAEAVNRASSPASAVASQ